MTHATYNGEPIESINNMNEIEIDEAMIEEYEYWQDLLKIKEQWSPIDEPQGAGIFEVEHKASNTKLSMTKLYHSGSCERFSYMLSSEADAAYDAHHEGYTDDVFGYDCWEQAIDMYTYEMEETCFGHTG